MLVTTVAHSSLPGIYSQQSQFNWYQMSQPKITLHWLEQSRAFRVIWLLEKLELKYDIVPYKRDKESRGPESLRKIHPLGRSPIVVIENEDGSKKTLVESGFIFHYLVNHFDKENKLINEANRDDVEFYFFYAEGSLNPPSFIEYLFSRAKQASTPFGMGTIRDTVVNKLSAAYSHDELHLQFEFVENTIKDNLGYLVGGKLTAADIIISFTVQLAFARKFIDAKTYPNLDKWYKEIQTDPEFKKALAIAKSYGSDF